MKENKETNAHMRSKSKSGNKNSRTKSSGPPASENSAYNAKLTFKK